MNYFDHPFVSNSSLSKMSPKSKDGSFVDAYRMGTLVDADITTPWTINRVTLKIDDHPEYYYTREDFDLSRAMKQAYLADKFCSDLLNQCSAQCEIYNENLGFDYLGNPFYISTKIKYDLWSWELNWGGDIKSTTATTHEQFLAAIKHFDYDRQRFFYMKNSGAKKDVIIGISKIKPHNIFKVFIKQNDDLYLSGMRKTNELAYRYWKENPPF